MPQQLSPWELESKIYYAGLPSRPVLVARTGAPWKPQTGPGSWTKLRELRAVAGHALKEIWEDNLALKLHAILDSMKVKWTSTDVVRIGDPEESCAPVILWIGVIPTSLSHSDGVVVVTKCRELLVEYDITDVDVEIRESVVTRSAGPMLLPTPEFWNRTIDAHETLTPTLGLSICAQSTPWAEGTGGFFITEGQNTDRLLLVTARHVVFPPDGDENKHFERKNDNQRRHDVRLLGDAAFKRYLESIKDEIRGNTYTTAHHQDRIKNVEGEDNTEANRERQHAQSELKKAIRAGEMHNTLYQNLSTNWATPESRILGHVILSPPISIGSGSENYTEDWAVIEIEASKIDASNFKGNAIDLGTSISPGKFTHMINLTFKSRSPRPFEYPLGGLLRLKDTIPDDEMRYPTALDQNDEPCLMVIKRGNATDLTVGRANEICSYARNPNVYHNDIDKAETSKEWAILPFDQKSNSFSAEGDSGSVVVDGLGRIGGLITGGAGSTSDSDITYATPISFLLKRMQECGLRDINIDPVLTA